MLLKGVYWRVRNSGRLKRSSESHFCYERSLKWDQKSLLLLCYCQWIIQVLSLDSTLQSTDILIVRLLIWERELLRLSLTFYMNIMFYLSHKDFSVGLLFKIGLIYCCFQVLGRTQCIYIYQECLGSSDRYEELGKLKTTFQDII